MSKPAAQAERRPTDWNSPAMQKRIRRRYAAERRFRVLGAGAVILSAAFLGFLLLTMVAQGWRGFTVTELALPIDLKADGLKIERSQLATPAADLALASAGLEDVVDNAATRAFGADGATYLAPSAWLAVRGAVKRDPSLLERRTTVYVPAATGFDRALAGDGDPAMEAGVARLTRQGAIHRGFNWTFLSESDSTDPVAVGVWGALKGSLLTMAITFLIAFPVGVLSAIYLEEYAPKNRWTDLIEVSINNLAAVPSIIFGLLGLAMFLGTWQIGGHSFGPMLPRSAPLVGGVTLALMIMPVIVIASRNAIKGVPPSIRDAALGIGASPIQVVFHHVLPLAMPGILTGTIIGMARALGETAPLLLIGMRAFIVTAPGGFTDPSTVLPVQIFLWSDEVSRGFVEKTSAAILVLLAVLLAMNGLAIYLRNKFETRW
ncbi:phosphate ABC transporter permease PtsA [Sphingomonas sp. ABOLD]|uniref:Phosphate transport system permease protein PstA n=1 Tax=Sphingomonas trueperi TaxID=53317 RepID=A0A7X5XZW7_9SPHN|nr:MULTISPECIES: phosphate ABC transporter permease PstA [Sphingomonas]NJB98468.1 phosphate transport system permease protein [Sphingomonas trueperi]RSV33884.1 phosphate ABC transporter permease PtsA [Sphingomonas sp. ABOLE]RSV39682.1 phosphate ABC transporter permease PtsA [Sphingomonas sp. ABOLD]